METRECESCTYAMPIAGSDWVECRRYPPIDSSTSTSGFPTSPRTGWCGEFKRHVVPVSVTERL